MAKLYNLARVTTATTGIGTLTLGGAVPGFLTFAQAGAQDADVIAYAIRDGANSEIGYGTYTAASTTLTRTVRKSTQSDAAITLTGNAEVVITPSADELTSEIWHIQDFGGVGDGVTDNTTALQALKTAIEADGNGVALLTGGVYAGGKNYTGTTIWSNNVEPTVMRFDKPSVMGLFEGNSSDPDTVTDDPVLWAQKVTKFDNAADSDAHNVGGVFAEVVVHGSGLTGATETSGAWIGAMGNTVLLGTNVGTEGTPDYDLTGAAVGLAGFARSEKPNGITAGVWAYATTPEQTDTEFDAWGTNFSTVGLEVNIESRHKDAGPDTDFGIKGNTTGVLLANFPSVIGVRDWTFGIAFYPQPDDGDTGSTDPANWHGFHDGVFVDMYKRAGIRLGRGISTAYGILFPSTYSHANFRPAAAMHLGDNQMNLGEYTAATFANGDFWRNGNLLFCRQNGVSENIVANRTSAGSTTDNAVSRWDGTDGSKVQNSGVLIDDSSNLMVPSGLRVGFTGTATADRIEIGDANFFLDFGNVGASTPFIFFDSGDSIRYDRTTNTFVWAIGNTDEVFLSASAVSPAANDGNALGTASLGWADLFLAAGGEVRVNNVKVLSTQQAAIANLAWTYSANDPNTVPDSAQTFADGTALVAATAYGALDEIEAKINGILAALRTHGIIAT